MGIGACLFAALGVYELFFVVSLYMVVAYRVVFCAYRVVFFVNEMSFLFSLFVQLK